MCQPQCDQTICTRLKSGTSSSDRLWFAPERTSSRGRRWRPRQNRSREEIQRGNSYVLDIYYALTIKLIMLIGCNQGNFLRKSKGRTPFSRQNSSQRIITHRIPSSQPSSPTPTTCPRPPTRRLTSASTRRNRRGRIRNFQTAYHDHDLRLVHLERQQWRIAKKKQSR